MKGTHIKRLSSLLSTVTIHDADLSLRIHRVLEDLDDITKYSTSLVPQNEVYEIYQRRSEHSKERKLPIEGFDHLLHKLDPRCNKSVRIHGLIGENRDYTVFTDKKTNVLYGVLVIERD